MITAHVLVKNEENFIWYSIMSVIDHIDKIMIWDTGSTDNTWEIITELKKRYKKISAKRLDLKYFDEGKIRQSMLEETKTPWFIVVDGDEIWWNDSISHVIKFINDEGKDYESVVVPTINLVGDIFHYQEKEAGKYKLLGMKGHYNLRAINTKIPGLKSSGEHMIGGWVDNEGEMIQERDPKRIKFIDAPYIHGTYLQRAGVKTGDSEVMKRSIKLKRELGISFPRDFYYPEVFFKVRPTLVPNVWKNMDFGFRLRAFFETPFRKIKRRLI